MTDPNHQKILDKVDASREQAIGFLQKMVAIPSVTGDEAAIQKFGASLNYSAQKTIGDGRTSLKSISSRTPN